MILPLLRWVQNFRTPFSNTSTRLNLSECFKMLLLTSFYRNQTPRPCLEWYHKTMTFFYSGTQLGPARCLMVTKYNSPVMNLSLILPDVKFVQELALGPWELKSMNSSNDWSPGYMLATACCLCYTMACNYRWKMPLREGMNMIFQIKLCYE